MNNVNDKNSTEYSLTLVSGKHLKLNGVKQILSFDNLCVLLSTIGGDLEVTGDSLSIDLLDLDNGLAAVSGTILGINYISERQKKRRWLRREE